MGQLSYSGEVLEPKKGAEHYQIASHAGIPPVLHFLLRTAGSIDFLFLTPFCQGSNLDQSPCDTDCPSLRPGTLPDAPRVRSLSVCGSWTEFGTFVSFCVDIVSWVSVLRSCACHSCV